MVLEPIPQQIQAGYGMLVGFKVGCMLCGSGMVFIVTHPWREIHDLVELDEDGIVVQHGVDPVEDKEHQLALLLHRSAVGIYMLVSYQY